MNKSKSLLSHNESDFIKGILIILIIVGHNYYIIHGLNFHNSLKDFLYAFHIHSFFYLPVLYNVPDFSFYRVKKDFIRLFTPYTIFFIILLICNIFIHNYNYNLLESFWGYLSGSSNLLSIVTGTQFLWFLPAMFSFLIIRNLYFTYIKAKIPILLISTFTLLILALGLGHNVDINLYCPLGIFYALSNFSIAIFLRFIIENYSNKIWFKLFFPIAFVLILTIYSITDFNRYTYYPFIYIIIPIIAFPTIFLLSKTKLTRKKNVFIFLGKLSLPLYLFHQIIYNLLCLFLDKSHFNNYNTIILGVFVFILTLFLNIMLIYILKFLFPKIYKLFS